MADAATVLRSYGMGLADELVQAAQLEGIDLAAAATIISMESNGRNVWGSDPVATGGAYVKGAPVTQANYLAYRSLMKAGKIGRQGCGPSQATSAQYQDTADALGGCWVPLANYRSGFRGLQALIKAYGLREGARHYNGSGPAAERYADIFMSRYSTWKTRLAGAVVPPPPDPEGDDMAQVPQEQWDLAFKCIKDFFADQIPTWGGGTDETLNGLGRSLRSNVETRQAWEAVQRVDAKVDALAAKLDALIAKQA